jgi:AraC-like DNA-binding protein
MNKRYGPVILRWFVSYLAILVISLVFSVAVYFYSHNIINKSSGEFYEASLEQFRIEVDNFINGSIQSLQQLALNTDIRVLTLIKDDLQPRHRWNIFQAVKEINKIKLILPLVDDIFVVLNPLDSVITSSTFMPMDNFYQDYYQNEGVGFEEFREIMNEPRRNEIALMNNRLLFLLTSGDDLFGDTSTTLAISYRKNLFDLQFLNSYEVNDCRIFIRPKSSLNAFGSGMETGIPSFTGNRGIINGVSYTILSVDSHVMNWTYFYLIPESLEKAKARQIQVFTLIGLFICTFLGLFVSLFLTRRNYDPVKKLIAVFNRSEGIYDTGNESREYELSREDEFRWIEKRAMDTQRTLGNNFKILRNHYIHALLEKPFDPVHGKNEMERYNIRLKGEWNLVAVYSIPGFPSSGSVLSENEVEIINTMQYIINHILMEAVGNSFIAEMCAAGEYAAAIINWSGDRDAFIARLEEIIEYTQQETGDLLHFPVVTALGEPRQGIEGVYYSGLEAMETLRYLELNTGQSILHYRDIKYTGNKYSYPQETEQKLINLIRIGDADAAVDLFRQIWAENVSSQNFQGRIVKLLSYDILGSLTKGMEQDLVLDDILLRNFNLEMIPLGELADTLEKAVKDICRSNSLFRRNRSEYQFRDKIKKYIEENYKNPDLNISITSFHFGMNPAYLSTVFKEETNLGLLEYINTLRIEEGKKLLRSGCDVNEAAELAGFRGSGTFSRVFKKMAGVTPGQYREL